MLKTIRRKRFIRYFLLVANLLLLLGVGALVINNSKANTTTKQNSIANIQGDSLSNPLDRLSSSDIAAHAALLTRVDEAVSVANKADSVTAELTIIPSDERIVSKPQIVTTALKSKRDITKYVVAQGDTVTSLAAKFSVTSDAIRWSNGLTGDSIPVGREIYVLPGQNGIVYEVRAGDTPDSLASRYRANKDLIVAMNDAEVSGLVVGERIIIPDGVQPSARASVYSGGFAFGSSAVYGYNGYSFGWCTWWAAKRRADIGRPVPANLGNAWTWASRAAAAGIPVGDKPAGGAVIMTRSGPLGHVGYVEQVLEDGSVWVTDMNSSGQVSATDSRPAGGWNRVSWRKVTPDQFHRFRFIY